MNKELLEVLVTEVNAKLLERIRLKRLKPKDIQYTNGQPLLFGCLLQGVILVYETYFPMDSCEYLWLEDSLVDLLDNPDELTSIDALHKGITHISCTSSRQRANN